MNGPPEHRTVQTVVYFIGATALVLTIGDIALVAVVLASGRDVAPAAVALIATVSGLAGTSIGSLASMLVSTKPAPVAGDPTTFTAPAGASVSVEPPPEPPANPARPKDEHGDSVPVRPSPAEPTSARRKRTPRKQAATQRHDKPAGR